MTGSKPTLAIIGGTGNLGTGLARRWLGGGYEVIIGSRTAEKARQVADTLIVPEGGRKAVGDANFQAANLAEIIVLTVPYGWANAILDDIKPAVHGKIVVDTTVPLMLPKVARVQLPPEGSAAVAAQKRLGDGARVVSAFHNVAAQKLQSGVEVDCDVLVFGDSPDDREVVIALAEAAGLRGIHGGPLDNSAAAEALTSVLIGINRKYGVEGAGIRITGIA
jgi:hypothetical protein